MKLEKVILKLTEQGLRNAKVALSALNWKANYIFMQNNEEKTHWWYLLSDHQIKSGELFETLQEVEDAAFIHWCNNKITSFN